MPRPRIFLQKVPSHAIVFKCLPPCHIPGSQSKIVCGTAGDRCQPRKIRGRVYDLVREYLSSEQSRLAASTLFYPNRNNQSKGVPFISTGPAAGRPVFSRRNWSVFRSNSAILFLPWNTRALLFVTSTSMLACDQ